MLYNKCSSTSSIYCVYRARCLGMRGKVDVETVMEVCEPLLLNFTTLQCLGRRKKGKTQFPQQHLQNLALFLQVIRCTVKGTRQPCSPAHSDIVPLFYTFQHGVSVKAQIIKCYNWAH